MKQGLLVLLSFMLVGCASMGFPGSISENVSSFDGAKEVSMEPAWLIGGSNSVKLGLFKSSKMWGDKAILNAVVKGAYNFSPKQSLQFNVDGNVTSFDSLDALTDLQLDPGVLNSTVYIPPEDWSSKRYLITGEFIKKLLEAKKVWVKVNLVNEYAEGEFSNDSPGAARPAFKEFYKRIWGVK